VQPDTATLPAPHARLIDRIPAQWRQTLLALAATALALGVLTGREWAEMFDQWWNIDTYSHLLLVPFIIAWLAVLKAGELARIAPQAFLPGLALVAAGLGLWWAGRSYDINLIAHAGAVGALQGAVVAVIGLRASLLLALPLAMGVFLVPFGDEIIPPLQFITADIAIALTHLSGIPAKVDGIYIDTPVGLFIVAEACSGVKFLIAMVTLGVLVAFTRFDTWRRRVLFLAACMIVPVLANGVRAWGTIYVAQFAGVEFAAGFDHIVYGWIFFAIIVAAMLGAAWRFFEREPEEYGWTAADLAVWDWVSGQEARSLAPLTMALSIAGLAAIAALAVML
jgi:exosortase A